MHRSDHPLPGQSLGRQTTVSSLHYGVAGARPKAYVQASLHAEELPGMLAAHHLRGLLEAAVQQGRLIGEVVLVPVANPIGLAQRVDHKAMGRFELDSLALSRLDLFPVHPTKNTCADQPERQQDFNNGSFHRHHLL